MKRHIFNILLGLMIVSCTEPFMGQTATDDVAPGPIKNARVTNLEGSAYITYDLPEDEDLLYVKARYQRNKDVIAENKASVYTDTLRIVGLGDTLTREVEVVAVDRSGNISEPVYVTIHPLTPPIEKVFKSLTVAPALSGIQLNWNNEQSLNLAISVIKWDKKEYIPVETIYSSRPEGSYGVRKQKAKETLFGIFMRDKWLNYTDTVFVTVTPFYEERVEGLAMYTMQGDAKSEWADFGFKPEYLFDDSRTDGGFHTTNSSGKLPHRITFKSEKAYQLRRFKIFQRSEENYPYNNANPQIYELWGTNETPNPDGSYDGWTCVGTFESVKPSGLPIGQLSSEDRETAALGEEHLLPNDIGYYKYWRLKVTKSWASNDSFHIKRIELYGIPEDFDPDAPVDEEE